MPLHDLCRDRAAPIDPTVKEARAERAGEALLAALRRRRNADRCGAITPEEARAIDVFCKLEMAAPKCRVTGAFLGIDMAALAASSSLPIAADDIADLLAMELAFMTGLVLP